MLPRLRRLFTIPAIPSWVAFVWSLVDHASNIQFVASFAQYGRPMIGLIGEYGWVGGILWLTYVVLGGPLPSMRGAVKPPDEEPSSDDDLATAVQRDLAASEALTSRAMRGIDQLDARNQTLAATLAQAGEIKAARTRIADMMTRLEARTDALVDAPMIQFVNAWMMPAWEKAISVLIPIRSDVKRRHGDRIEALLQMGVFDRAIPTWRAVKERISGERAGDLDELVTAMYEQYESIVRWIDEAGDMVEQPYADSRRFQEWQEEDRKLTDKLREFVASPSVATSKLASVRARIDEGGVNRIVRERLGKRPSSGRDGGVG